ncbi:metalloregulator ArsR/SmtB family transcription factor [Shewanella sp. 4_MG-2023]|uniref:metalloregulator ArsR/SmtB family transcription factor n=1 Tax=Shewanella sp. 4_MG-2023 TaxID=3062652 RepID=UPI0026E3EE02|nr:metalloregulator ArsR/SmtB family transcription factor [Shewanella sp. 4_MG-2023]MDO6679040.1 metalloregulator ArsR/SmtB family transcription factor [Shewanella sp. 4_MG-2023]
MSINKQRVLFLCTGNSARSQMAEVLLKHRAGDRFEVYSAGTQPEAVDPRAIDALHRFGIDTANMTQLVSNPISDFKAQQFDYVITLCDRATDECRSYEGAGKQLAWDFPDPKSRQGYHPFLTTLNELNNRLSMFLLVEAITPEAITPETITSESATSNEGITSLEPSVFYKCLTDDIRLKTLMLTHYHGELCVCELMQALAEDSQPKVSRNLAVLKKANIISDRKHGQWVFYRINPDLPMWAKCVIAQTTENNIPLISEDLQRLALMQCRPNKASFCK